MAKIIGDFGNARWKWFIPATKEKGDYRHAVAVLTENDWREIAGRGKLPQGIARINGKPYAFGDKARRYTLKERPKGAARYTPEYYGAAMAFIMADVLRVSDKRISIFASHAPQDIQYAHKIEQALDCDWVIECAWGTLNIGFKDIRTFEEPIGGLSHASLNEDGEQKKKNPFQSKTVLVVDVGGYTVDVVAVDPGGEIDTLSAKSTRTGTINLMGSFERDLRANNLDMFQSTGELDPKRIEAALINGYYAFGKVSIPCIREAQENISVLVNDIIQIINEAGGVANYDIILMTGGGGALVYDTLCSALPTVDFTLAEENRDLMKYANVFGGAKLAALLKRYE